MKSFIQIGLLWALVSVAALAQEPHIELQQQWETGKYELDGDDQEKFFSNLISQVETAKANHNDNAEVLAWSGIVLSTYASVKGGLGALKFAKQAKKDLEKSIDLDATALQGAASTTLGALLFKVPGWPVGFGNDKKAKQYLDAALAINPNGIDSNYWYAEYWYKKGDTEQALVYLDKAEQAPPRPNRPLADKGRLEEVAKLRATIESLP